MNADDFAFACAVAQRCGYDSSTVTAMIEQGHLTAERAHFAELSDIAASHSRRNVPRQPSDADLKRAVFRMSTTEPEYVTIEDAAMYLAVDKRTVRRMISRGEIGGYRVGARLIRVDMNEVRAFIRPIPVGRSAR